MITLEQKKWLDHLNDLNSTEVIAYNPLVKQVFKKIKNELISVIGDVSIVHRGSTALKIAGQGEIDLYVPVALKKFNLYLGQLSKYLGEPGSVYELRRARFVKYVDSIKVEIFLINRNSKDWKHSLLFENYLKKNPQALAEYEKLKMDNRGKSTKHYYTKKIEFINKVINLIK